MKECAPTWRSTSAWRSLFGLGVWCAYGGRQYGGEFFAGWLTEYSLSIDNLFIFIIIMSKFAVPAAVPADALLIGIVMALMMRAIFIAVGAAAINEFSWVFYLFGVFLIYTAFKLAKEGAEDEDDDYEENRAGGSSSTTSRPPRSGTASSSSSSENGKRLITPMFIVVSRWA